MLGYIVFSFDNALACTWRWRGTTASRKGSLMLRNRGAPYLATGDMFPLVLINLNRPETLLIVKKLAIL